MNPIKSIRHFLDCVKSLGCFGSFGFPEFFAFLTFCKLLASLGLVHVIFITL